MRFKTRGERDAAFESGMADGVVTSYDRLETILASAKP